MNNDEHPTRFHGKVCESLVWNPDGVYVDCTLGGGGHSAALLDFLSPKGQVIAIDQDLDAIQVTIPLIIMIIMPISTL